MFYIYLSKYLSYNKPIKHVLLIFLDYGRN